MQPSSGCAKCDRTIHDGVVLMTQKDGSLICTDCAGGKTIQQILHELNEKRKGENQ